MAQHITLERRPPDANSSGGGGYALLTIAKEPVNSFDTAMWEALDAAVAEAEADASLAGLIIASGLTRDVFTAGNDLKELYAPLTSAAQYRRFWEAQSRALTRIAGSRLATLAAIRGACPAGGCAIALCCDARVMLAGRGAIGLNEVALGIPVPKYWAAMMARVVGTAAAERLLLAGAMPGPDEALRLGLVDELVAKREELLPRAEALMRRAARLPPRARAETKARLRADVCAEWLAYALEWEAGPEGFARITHPDTVASVGAALQRLGGGKGGGGQGGGARPKL